MRECGECERLWREYSQATTEHIKLTGKQRIAHLQHDVRTETALDEAVAAAEAARFSARDAIRDHEAVAHDETGDRLPNA